MTSMRTDLAAADVCRAGPLGAWRVAASVPAMVGSLLLLLVICGWMGHWEGAGLLTWLGSGAAVFTRVGERAAVVARCGFRRPSRAQALAVEPVWASALARAGLSAHDVDLYVKHIHEVNAYAVGGRSVALTSGLMTKFQARRLGSGHLEAILVHELGHHATRATRFALVSMWLTTPWRFASRLVIGVSLSTVGRGPSRRLLALVVVTCLLIGVAQTAQQGRVDAAIVLAIMGVCAVGCPLADAWVSRRSEYDADRFAVACRVGMRLVDALNCLDNGERPHGWTQRALSQHPSIDSRVEAMHR